MRLPPSTGAGTIAAQSDGRDGLTARNWSDRADPHDRTPKVFYLVNGHLNVFVLGFGEDARGELYVLANKTGGSAEETGLVMKIVRECADDAYCRD